MNFKPSHLYCLLNNLMVGNIRNHVLVCANTGRQYLWDWRISYSWESPVDSTCCICIPFVRYIAEGKDKCVCSILLYMRFLLKSPALCLEGHGHTACKTYGKYSLVYIWSEWTSLVGQPIWTPVSASCSEILFPSFSHMKT